MIEKRYTFECDGNNCQIFENDVWLKIEEVVDLLNEQQATIEHLKERLYDFEKRKIIGESETDENVIPKIKMLRTELFGEKNE